MASSCHSHSYCNLHTPIAEVWHNSFLFSFSFSLLMIIFFPYFFLLTQPFRSHHGKVSRDCYLSLLQPVLHSAYVISLHQPQWCAQSHRQCTFNFSRCFKNLMFYNKTSPPTLKCLVLRWWSCHVFCLWFSVLWWNPATKHSSIWMSYNNICSKASTLFISVSTTILMIGTIYSIGTTNSFPYTSLNGVCHVNHLHVVQYAHSTAETLWSQSSLRSLHTLINAFSRILLKDSTVPLGWRW